MGWFDKPSVVIFYNTRLSLCLRESLVAAGREFYFGCGLIMLARLSTTSQGSFGEWLPTYRTQKCDSRLYTQGGNREDFGGVNIRPSWAFLFLLLYWFLSCLYLPVPNPFQPHSQTAGSVVFWLRAPLSFITLFLTPPHSLLFLTLYLCDIS